MAPGDVRRGACPRERKGRGLRSPIPLALRGVDGATGTLVRCPKSPVRYQALRRRSIPLSRSLTALGCPLGWSMKRCGVARYLPRGRQTVARPVLPPPSSRARAGVPNAGNHQRVARTQQGEHIGRHRTVSVQTVRIPHWRGIHVEVEPPLSGRDRGVTEVHGSPSQNVEGNARGNILMSRRVSRRVILRQLTCRRSPAHALRNRPSSRCL